MWKKNKSRLIILQLKLLFKLPSFYSFSWYHLSSPFPALLGPEAGGFILVVVAWDVVLAFIFVRFFGFDSSYIYFCPSPGLHFCTWVLASCLWLRGHQCQACVPSLIIPRPYSATTYPVSPLVRASVIIPDLHVSTLSHYVNNKL